MSIEEKAKKGKLSAVADLPSEESFDIQTTGTSAFAANWKKHAFILSLIILIAGASFGLGRFLTYEKDRTPITVSAGDNRSLVPAVFPQGATALTAADLGASAVSALKPKTAPKPVSVASSTADYNGSVVASKTGKKYYFPWCGTANRITPANKIYFATIAAARAAGLLPSSTCKGLQ